MKFVNGHMKANDEDPHRHALPQGECPIQMSQIQPKCHECGDASHGDCDPSAWPHVIQVQTPSLEYLCAAIL